MQYLLAPLLALGASMMLLLRWTIGLGIAFAIGKILAWLGVGYLTYEGMMYSTDYFVGIIQDSFSSISPQFFQLASAVATDIKLNESLSLILSAFAIRFALLTAKPVLGTGLNS